MRKIELNLSHIATVRALHIYIAYMMELPAYYGKNLDALHDVLTDVDEETCLHVKPDAQPSAEMRAYMPRLLRVFEDSAKENKNLTVVVG